MPLAQFKQGGLHVIFYEHLCTQPEVEMQRLFSTINLPYRKESFVDFGRPSTTSLPTSAVLTGDDRLERWKRILTAGTVHDILTTVDRFGLAHLYGEMPLPLIENPYYE